MAAHPKPLPELPPKALQSSTNKLRTTTGKAPLHRRAAREPIAAAKAKAHFLQLLDQVQRDREPVIITKRGRVVAQLVPFPVEQNISKFDSVFGSMAGTGKVVGDIVSPDWDAWGPEWR